MAKTIKTKEELQSNIEKAKSEIRQGENYVKQLLRQTSQLERKQRTHRLIERGAITESLIDGADTLTNEQLKTLLSSALRSPDAQKMITFFKKSNSVTPENRPPQAD